MIDLLLAADVKGPEIDYEGLVAAVRARRRRGDRADGEPLPRRASCSACSCPALTLAALGAALGLTIWQWETGDLEPIVENALAVDTLALGVGLLFYAAGDPHGRPVAALRGGARGRRRRVLRAAARRRSPAWSCSPRAENLVTLFVGLELLSIPLYALCATELRRGTSLESGLKYLIIGSLGSATLLYGLAMIYGATGATDFGAIADAIGDTVGLDDPLLLIGIALAATGLAFKASVAPFHQWSPDVYQGAPTPITAFMATATKAAAFARDPAPVRPRARRSSRPTGAPRWRRSRRSRSSIGNVGALGAALAQAAARVVGRRAGGLPARRRGRRARSSGCRRRSSTSRSTC